MSAIVGVYEGPLDWDGRPCVEIAAVAAAGALRDAGMTLADVDGVLAAYAWEEPSLMFAPLIADYLALTPRYVETVCFGGASPAMMVARAAHAIERGECEVALLMAVSNRASKLGRAGAIAALRDVLSPEFEVPYGVFVPPAYALTATRYMHEWGTTAEQLAAIAVTQREHAARHPAAAQRELLTVADVVGSPMVSSPLHLLDCCLVTDFGSAIVMTSAGRAATLSGARPVSVLGSGEAHERLTTSEAGDLTSRGAAKSGPAALARAGLAIDQIGFAELYDSFTITVISTLEDLGFSAKGQAGREAQEGAFAAGGRLPLNTNGGMLSYRTGGMSHVIEAVHQLRGSAPGITLDSPRHALVHGIGGILSSHCTLVLGVG